MELAAESLPNPMINSTIWYWQLKALVMTLLAMVMWYLNTQRPRELRWYWQDPWAVQAAEPAAGAWARVTPCCSPQGVKKIIIFFIRQPWLGCG